MNADHHLPPHGRLPSLGDHPPPPQGYTQDGHGHDDDTHDGYGHYEANKLYANLKKLTKIVLLVLVPMVVVAFILSIIAFTRLRDENDLISDDPVLSGLTQYFPGLIETDGGMAVRIDSGDCYGDDCDDLDSSIYCDIKGSLRTFTRPDGGELFCVCDGRSWKCEVTGKFCTEDPELPHGGELEYGKSCVNTPSSGSCSFACSDSLVPSGEFTCTNGKWDIQYCICSAADLVSELDSLGILGVSNLDSCDHFQPGEVCDQWTCNGDLWAVEHSQMKCENYGWDINGDTLCVCQPEQLHNALSVKKIDFIDITGCVNIPAGHICPSYDWHCPHKLRQEGVFQCNEEDGSWDITDYPCLCVDGYNDEYTEKDIPGFKRSCGYLHVGQVCPYRDWQCEDYLIPITDLECTADGLKGECGCSLDQLEDPATQPPVSEFANIEGCDETPIGEECTDWTCDNKFEKKCCNSPICTETGHWNTITSMCKGCDPADLTEYGPTMSCGTDLVGPGATCDIACVESGDPSPNFQCPADSAGNGQMTCEATCLHGGVWDIPCVCDPSTLAKKVPSAEFITFNDECKVGDKCEIECEEGTTALEPVVCNAWVGFVGECGCQSLGDTLNCDDDETTCHGFDLWGCESYEIGEVCTDVCNPPFVTRMPYNDDISNLLCTEKGWSFFTDVLISDDSVDAEDICGCNPCDVLDEISQHFCIPEDTPMEIGTSLSTGSDLISCGDDLEFYGDIECQYEGPVCSSFQCGCVCDMDDLYAAQIDTNCHGIVGEECNIFCEHSGQLTPEISICLPDGRWSYVCQICEGAPPLPEFALDSTGNCSQYATDPQSVAHPGDICDFTCACPLVASGVIECTHSGWDENQFCGCDPANLNALDASGCTEITPINDNCTGIICFEGNSTMSANTTEIDAKCQTNGWSVNCGCSTDDLGNVNATNTFCPTQMCSDCVVGYAEFCSVVCIGENTAHTTYCQGDGSWTAPCI